MRLLLLSFGMGVFVLLALALRRLAGKRLPARLFAALWPLCAVRLLLPVALPCRMSLWGLLQPQSLLPEAGRTEPPLSPSAAMVSRSEAPVLFAAAKRAPVDAAAIFAAFWALGALALLGWFLFCHIRMLRALRAAKPAEDTAQWLKSCGFSFHRKISIRMLDDARAPLTYGIFSPVIILPPALGKDSLRCRFALTHELVHVRRFDCLRKLLLALALCVHWMNPAVWLMVRAAKRDLELACDEETLKRLGAESRKAYCLMLLDCVAHPRPRIPLGSALGQSATEERIRRMMKPRKMSILTILLAVLLLASSFTVLATQTPSSELTSAAEEASVNASVEQESEAQEEAIPSVQQEAAAPEEETPSAQQETSAPEEETPSAIAQTEPEASAQEVTSPAWLWPCQEDAAVTDSFGSCVHPVTGQTSFHNGVDFGAGYDSSVYAMCGGTVAEASYSPSAGYHVIIDHEDGWQSVYQHLHTMAVSAGDTVSQGDVIGAVGASGWAVGAHLHVSLLKDGAYVDPMQYLG